MKKEIWFDMDGTIANLYAVHNWLIYLECENPFPYENAMPMMNFSRLAKLLNKLQKNGWKIGIISWTAKYGSDNYNSVVAKAKTKWLAKHLKSVQWDEIKIVKYGTNKFSVCGGGILFDDEEGNRTKWMDEAYEPNKIFEVLNGLRTRA